MFSLSETDCPLRSGRLWNGVEEHPCQENIGLWISASLNKTLLSCVSGRVALWVMATSSFSQDTSESKHLRFRPSSPLWICISPPQCGAVTVYSDICCWATPRTQKRATVRARGQCEQEPPHAHVAQTWEVAWVFYLRHADIITEQVIIKLFSYQQTKPCDLVYKRSQPTRAAAHRGTFMQMRHTFPHPELDTNSHSLQTHIRKHKCTKRAHTRRYCSLSIPNPDDRAAPPHNNLFMESKNVSGSRLQNTHGTRLEGAIASRNLKLETRPKNTVEEASYTTEAPAVRKLLQLCQQPTC